MTTKYNCPKFNFFNQCREEILEGYFPELGGYNTSQRNDTTTIQYLLRIHGIRRGRSYINHLDNCPHSIQQQTVPVNTPRQEYFPTRTQILFDNRRLYLLKRSMDDKSILARVFFSHERKPGAKVFDKKNLALMSRLYFNPRLI